MIFVIQCAASKRPDAGYFYAKGGKKVLFVADPASAPARSDLVYAQPDGPGPWRTDETVAAPIRYVAEPACADTHSERAIRWGGVWSRPTWAWSAYVAALLGQGDEVVLRWFILVVALLLDPAAMLLLLASARRED